MKEIHSDLVNSLNENMTPEQMNTALENIATPEDGDNYLINTQLKMLRRHLGIGANF